MDVSDYLTENEKREIATQMFRDLCATKLQRDFERIISNAAHDTAQKIVAETLGESMNESIAKKAVEIIENLGTYTIFKAPDAWDRSASPAWNVLMQATVDNKDLVKAKVEQAIKTISKKEALEIIKAKQFTLS